MEERQAPVLFPNPVADYFEIHLPEEDLEQLPLSIYDQTGQLVHNFELNAENGILRITIDQLSLKQGGIYFCEYTTSNGTFINKFIKAK